MKIVKLKTKKLPKHQHTLSFRKSYLKNHMSID